MLLLSPTTVSDSWSLNHLLSTFLYLTTSLVLRPHHSARPLRFGSRGPFVSDTSPKCIDREGLRRRSTGTRQPYDQSTCFKLRPSARIISIRSQQIATSRSWDIGKYNFFDTKIAEVTLKYHYLYDRSHNLPFLQSCWPALFQVGYQPRGGCKLLNEASIRHLT